jgi:hypothetical protein
MAYIAQTGNKRKAYKVLAGKFARNRALGRQRS